MLMTIRSLFKQGTILAVILVGLVNAAESKRETDFNFGWRFILTDQGNLERPDLDDTTWREIRLPHDWSVEAAFDREKGEGATAYLPGGIGWYRKHFVVPAAAEAKLHFVCFDGVYNNAEVWINGEKLGFHPYGYTPFCYDLTPFLKKNGGENVLALKVDRSRYADSRWYPGSGIYRNVKLVTVDRLHVPVWGTYVTTPKVTPAAATAVIEIKVKNDYTQTKNVRVSTDLVDPSGRKVGQQTSNLTLSANGADSCTQQFAITSPRLWGLEHPEQYQAVTTVSTEEGVSDKYTTRFGIRSIRFDPNEAFFLNDVNLKIKGVCLHHDGGLVGAAVPAGVWRRRLAELKDAGCNAIRLSHNPASEEFLNLCDEMGFLVQEEFFDEWDNPKDKRLNKWETKVDYMTRGYGEHFQEWAERDLKAAMLRDRNHPSVFQWSIGNEIEWTYPAYAKATGFFDMDWKGNYFWSTPPNPPEVIRKLVREGDNGVHTMAGTAAKLAAWTREMDRTRPVILNSILPSASHESGVADAVDILGYSYRRVMYDYGHAHYPDKVIMGTENLPQWHEWKAILERPFISGTFLWTGIDYMGEARGGWPKKGTDSGLLDLAGFRKPAYHMLKSLWSEDPHVYLATQLMAKSPYRVDESSGMVVERKPGAWEHALWVWPKVNEHWNYAPMVETVVEVLSNCESVELLLNGHSLGTKHLADFADHIYKWAVPFESGSLVAQGVKQGQASRTGLVTSGEPVRIALTADRKALNSDGYDVVHVVAQLTDAQGNPVRVENRLIHFTVDGNARVLGVDNGAIDNVQAYQANQIMTDQGRCLLLIQAKTQAGTIHISAQAEGLTSSPLSIETK